MPVKIIVTHCTDHPVPASFGRFWAQSYFWINPRLHLIYQPQHTAVIKVSNKWDFIFNAVNCLLYSCRVLLRRNLRVISYTKHLPFTEKPDLQLQLYFLCLCPHSLSVKTLLLIIYWTVMKWQMIYWEPKTVFQRWTFLSFCVAVLPASPHCRRNK